MKKLLRFFTLLIPVIIMSQNLNLRPSSINIETGFDYKSNEAFLFQKVKLELEYDVRANDNVYRKISSIQNVVDNDGHVYKAKISETSFDNKSYSINVEFDSLAKTAKSISLAGMASALNRLDEKNRIEIKYSPEMLNKVVYQSADDKLKIYLIDLENLRKVRKSDISKYNKIIENFAKDFLFAYTESDTNFERVESKMSYLEAEKGDIIMYIYDEQKQFVHANLINSKKEIINNGYELSENSYRRGNDFFVKLYDFETSNDNRSVEILINKNILEIPFKLENIKIP